MFFEAIAMPSDSAADLAVTTLSAQLSSATSASAFLSTSAMSVSVVSIEQEPRSVEAATDESITSAENGGGMGVGVIGAAVAVLILVAVAVAVKRKCRKADAQPMVRFHDVMEGGMSSGHPHVFGKGSHRMHTTNL